MAGKGPRGQSRQRRHALRPPGGHGALLKNGDVSLRRVEIDVDAAVVAGSTYRDRAAWADDYLRAQASDTGAITAFGRATGAPSTKKR